MVMTEREFHTLVNRHFRIARKNGATSYQCFCPMPNHDDKNASCTVSYDPVEQKLLAYCHGCKATFEEIIASAGVPKEPKAQVVKSVDSLVEYPYYLEDGGYYYSKCRKGAGENKKMWFRVIRNGKETKEPIPKQKILYRLPELVKHNKEHPEEYIVIVEGEKDVETLFKLNITATTSGSADSWKKDFAKYFKDMSVVILKDNDKAGDGYAEGIIADIKSICKRYKVLITSEKPKGDVTDYLQEGHTKEELLQLIESVKWIDCKKEEKPLFTMASEVEVHPVEYLWFPYILSNNINTLGGEAGTGKTWFLCALISAITNGQQEGMAGEVRKKGKVLYLGGEDGNSAMVERLKSVGADLSKVALVENSFDCTSITFEELVNDVKPVLIIFDPLLSYFPEKKDANKYTDARYVMDYLRDVARKKHLSIVVVIHPPKKDDYRLIHRFTGSGGFVDAVRAVTYIGYHPADARKRIGIQPKNNTVDTVPFCFEIDRKYGFLWGGTDEEVTAQDIEKASRMQDMGNVALYVDVVKEALHINPDGLCCTASEILKEYSKVRKHSISAQSFGQILNKVEFQKELLKYNIALQMGSNTHNMRRYHINYKIPENE